MTIDTVERFQGSERRVMIMSTVRTDQIGFLNDYRVSYPFVAIACFNCFSASTLLLLELNICSLSSVIHIFLPKTLHGKCMLQFVYFRNTVIFFRFLYYLWMNNCFNIGSEGNETRNYWNRYFAKFKN